MRYLHKAKRQQRDGGLHGLIISHNLLKYLKEDRKGERDAVSCFFICTFPSSCFSPSVLARYTKQNDMYPINSY